MPGSSTKRIIAIALWCALLVPYALFCLALKIAPLWILAGLFVLHGLGHLGRLRWLETASQATAMIGVSAAAAGASAYMLAIWIAPPVTSDGQMVMPVGQALLGLLGAAAAGIAALVLYIRRWRHEPARSTARWLVHLAGLVTLGAAAYAALRLQF